MGSENLHEDPGVLSEKTKDLHRAIVSLMEELEAVDWYTQRAEACGDAELRAVLMHHRDEEIEHAMMNLEWIRRHEPVFDENMRTYLFASGDITAVEASVTGGEHERGTIEEPGGRSEPGGRREPGEPRRTGAPSGGSLNVGSLRRV